MRLGSATHRGHAELIFDRFGPFWGSFSMIDLGIGNFLTLITEFIAIRAAWDFWRSHRGCSRKCTRVFVLGCNDAPGIGRGNELCSPSPCQLCVSFPWPCSRIPIGTLSPSALVTSEAAPWRFEPRHSDHRAGGHRRNSDTVDAVFQQSATVDKGLTRKDIHLGRIDTVVGAALAAIAAVATILATAPLFAHHVTAENLQGAESPKHSSR